MTEEIQQPEITLDAAYCEMLYRQDRVYYEARAELTDKKACAALDAAYEAFKMQMQACETIEQLQALEQTNWNS